MDPSSRRRLVLQEMFESDSSPEVLPAPSRRSTRAATQVVVALSPALAAQPSNAPPPTPGTAAAVAPPPPLPPPSAPSSSSAPQPTCPPPTCLYISPTDILHIPHFFETAKDQINFYTNFVHREVVPGRPSDLNLMAQLGVTPFFERMGCTSLLSHPSIYYPHLVRMFYSNMTFNSAASSYLVTYVNGVTIRLDDTTLARILGFTNQSSLVVFPGNTWSTRGLFNPLEQTQTILNNHSIT